MAQYTCKMCVPKINSNGKFAEINSFVAWYAGNCAWALDLKSKTSEEVRNSSSRKKLFIMKTMYGLSEQKITTKKTIIINREKCFNFVVLWIFSLRHYKWCLFKKLHLINHNNGNNYCVLSLSSYIVHWNRIMRVCNQWSLTTTRTTYVYH